MRKRKPKKVKKKALKRRISFSEGLSKYDDVRHLKHPLREKHGPSIKDAVTITNMQSFRRYPVPE